ncbi:Hypothetical protein A7982_09347 [Minicystis rosea]|nr:Hypothetical protein A7982_09347 [Minicystis rosea]
MAAVLPLLVACGSGESTSGGGASGGNGGGTTSSGTTSSGTSSSGGSAVTKGGGVYVTSQTVDYGSGPMGSFVVSANFYDVSQIDGGFGVDCQQTTAGGCTLSLCSGAGNGGTGTTPTAGSIQVSTPTASATLIASGGTYAPATGQMMFWKPGEQVKVQADGDVVPAFTLTASAPAQIAVEKPAFPAPGMPLVVSASQDLEIAWTGQSAGKVVVSLGDGVGIGSIRCEFDPAAGKGAVPASMLAQFPKTTKGGFVVQTSDHTSTNAGGFDVQLYTLTSALVQGKIASAVLTLQ